MKIIEISPIYAGTFLHSCRQELPIARVETSATDGNCANDDGNCTNGYGNCTNDDDDRRKHTAEREFPHG